MHVLATSSMIALSIGIFPEPRPWHPVLKINMKPRGMKNKDIVWTYRMLSWMTVSDEPPFMKIMVIGEAKNLQSNKARIDYLIFIYTLTLNPFLTLFSSPAPRF